MATDELRAKERTHVPLSPSDNAALHLQDALVQWLYPLRKELTRLVESGSWNDEDVHRMLSRLIRAASETLRSERTSIWRLSPDGTSIECLILYERSHDRVSPGPRVTLESAPRYFEAIASEEVIVAHDAWADPRTSEFRDAYLEPLGIRSMLDAPVFVRGKSVGVICHEHIGELRQWQYWEQLVASTFADFVATTLDAQTRVRERAHGAELERLVLEARTENERSLQALLDSAPLPLALLRAGDARLVYANQKAIELFEADPDMPTLSDTHKYWVNHDDRKRFVSTLLGEGELSDYDVELRTSKGRAFWARMSAKAMRFRGELSLVVGLVDITARKRSEEALRRREHSLRTLVEAAPSPLVVTSAHDRRVIYANPPAIALFEVDGLDLVGKPSPNLFVRPEERDAFNAALARGDVEGFSAQLRSFKGKEFWVLLNARTTEIDGATVHLVGLTETSAQKELEQKLRELATTDDLTQTLNRRRFFELGESELRRTERYGGTTTLVMIDVDHFKSVNDLYGHAAGDAVLKQIAAILREQVRTTDFVARIGGEEFALLFPETPLEGAGATVERIRQAVADHVFASLPDGVHVTVSAGLVEHEASETLGDLLRRADERLYLAKDAGRNRVSMAPRSTAPRESEPPASRRGRPR